VEEANGEGVRGEEVGGAEDGAETWWAAAAGDVCAGTDDRDTDVCNKR